MRIFKHKRKSGESKVWYISFNDHNDIKRRLTGFTDKRATEEAGRKIEKLVDVVRIGEAPSGEQSRFIESMPQSWRSKLGEWSVLTSVQAMGTEIGTHIESFRKHLVNKGDTRSHVKTTCRSVETVFGACEF